MKVSLLLFFTAASLLLGSCANIVPPTGGDKDVTPPRLVGMTPPDSQLNLKPRKLVLDFDEYVTVSDVSSQVQIAPLLRIPLSVTASGKHVRVSIPDSLLQDETTYRISFGKAIRDVHEGNVYSSTGYLFSTGAHFDSMALAGVVINAATGLRDTGATVMLYAATDNDSAVVRRKPLYQVHVDGSGNFLLEGLPHRRFRIYALRDVNGNFVFDGGMEAIGFSDSLVLPAYPRSADIELFTFSENPNDSARATYKKLEGVFAGQATAPVMTDGYSVDVDTSDQRRRTHDLNKAVTIRLAQKAKNDLDKDKLFMSYDSSGTTIEADFKVVADTDGHRFFIQVPWLQNTLYTLRLRKGFAQDSSGHDLMPGRYSFRTKRDEDYGKLSIHLPGKYYGEGYVLQVANEHDTVYQQPVRDTMVSLQLLPPGTYLIRVVEDKNHNGRWDAGSLFLHRQPERVTPYPQPINLKVGWEQQIDFDEKPGSRKGFK